MRHHLLFSTSVCLLAFVCSCTEDIDTSDRYVFKEETVLSYLQKHEDSYSEYVGLLEKVPISTRSKSTVKQLLSARGNFTCFVPTNKAIAAYLQELTDEGLIESPSWDGFVKEGLLDSIQKVIVYNSVIDGGDAETYQTGDFPQQNNAEIGRANMNDSKLSVYRGDNNPDSIYINRTCPINMLNRDILTINGIIHQMEKVIAPNDETLARILRNQLEGYAEGYMVMAKIIDACGLLDTLSKKRDETYESLYQQGLIEEKTPANGLATMTGGYSYAPEHRKYGFTIFAEPDAFWEEAIGKAAADITVADVQEWVKQKGYYPNAIADENYQSLDNMLNQWTTYHVLPFKLSPDRLVFHYNEKGYDYNQPGKLSIPVMEYYVTMGKRRLLKLFESAESNGVYLNRFPILDNGRHGTGHETGCLPEKVGALVMSQDEHLDKRTAVNGYIYEIDAPIAYDEATRNNLGSTRIRMDCMSFFPEVMNNDIRRTFLTDAPHQWVHFPEDAEYKYIGNLSINQGSTFVYYNAHTYKFGSLCGDEVKCVGRWELVFTLPPVPKRGTYEVRYRILTNSDRGVAQFYFGEHLEGMPVAGIPVNLTLGGADPITGWTEDTGTDDDADARSDRMMRNNGFMKGEESILILKNPGTTARNNANKNIVRRIITRQTLDPEKTYYLKIKAVLDSEKAEFYMDHIEYCPKEIYDNPENPEDIW